MRNTFKSLLVWSLVTSTATSFRIPPREIRHLEAAEAAAVIDVMSGSTPPSSSSPSSPLEKRKDKEKTPKYFHEPGGSLELGHYDSRFFKIQVTYDEHRLVLSDLIRSYLTVLHEYGVETWLAHGSLLGWWWNGKIMPWDYDLDVQVSNDTLQWMADHLNRTEHTYNYTDPQTNTLVVKKYLLDINPHHGEIDRGDGMNIIDARWVDMQNGMFIDITGVREREADRPGYWTCKNKHRYHSTELWPMRVTEFEGVKARIPYNFEKMLIDEYGSKSLVTEEWSGHRWDRDIKDWVMMEPMEEAKRTNEAMERKKLQLQEQAARKHGLIS